MNKLPLARTTDVVVQNLGKELLIYNLSTNKAFNLNETSSTVYQACDGKTSFDELKRKHSFTDDLIFLALDQLKEDNLIEDESFVSPLNGVSRREVIRRVGLASMIALPVISSLIAPTAAMAQSGGAACQAEAELCTFDNFTQSNCCENLRCSETSCTQCLPEDATFFTGGPETTADDCNARPEKNLCCNSGGAKLDTSRCLCP